MATRRGGMISGSRKPPKPLFESCRALCELWTCTQTARVKVSSEIEQAKSLIDKQPVTSCKEGQCLIQMTFSGLYIYYSVIFKFKENVIKALKIRGAT